MYYKQSKGFLLICKTDVQPGWVKWVHHSEGLTHCPECLKLDGCFFAEGKSPPCPHHPYCHCTLDSIDYSVVLANASAQSDYRKFDPYLWDIDNFYKHGKQVLFLRWGYSIEDTAWLKSEIEKQAYEKYIAGDYLLGQLNHNGQRINIRVYIPDRNTGKTVSFITGWMARPNGTLTLNTPYGDV